MQAVALFASAINTWASAWLIFGFGAAPVLRYTT
jgi:hypothetical protein